MCYKPNFHHTFSDIIVKRKLFYELTIHKASCVFCVGIFTGFYIEFGFHDYLKIERANYAQVYAD
jgi:hypothetical protein